MEEIFKMWGTNEVEWVQNGNDNKFGGVLIMWRKKCFLLHNAFNGNNYSIISEGGWRIGDASQVTFVNMYNSGHLSVRRVVWDEVRERRRVTNFKAWCVAGDFNSIRRAEERRNARVDGDYRREMRRFNDFIEGTKLFDIPMRGRNYMWYKPNGLIKSRIDKCLVSKEWLDKWPSCRYQIEDRLVSDHCALILDSFVLDWGLKPFRCLDV